MEFDMIKHKLIRVKGQTDFANDVSGYNPSIMKLRQGVTEYNYAVMTFYFPKVKGYISSCSAKLDICNMHRPSLKPKAA